MKRDPATPVRMGAQPGGARGRTSGVSFGTSGCPIGTRSRRPIGAGRPNVRPQSPMGRTVVCTLLRDAQPGIPGTDRVPVAGDVTADNTTAGSKGLQ